MRKTTLLFVALSVGACAGMGSNEYGERQRRLEKALSPAKSEVKGEAGK
jgi:hypothetical protein